MSRMSIDRVRQGRGLSTPKICWKREESEVVMKRLCGALVVLLLWPAVYGERRMDRTLENIIRQFSHSLQYQTSDGDWEVVDNSPEDGFSAVTGSGAGQALGVICIPDEFYGAVLFWYEGGDSLGTDYEDYDDQPVRLNWRQPAQTQQTQWSHNSYDDREFDSVILIDQLRPEATDDFLDRLTRHGELNTVVTVSESGSTKQATFSLDGAPLAETVKACGQAQTSSSTTLYFPDFVDGGGWSVQLVLSNTSASTGDADVVVSVYDSEGDAVRGFFGSDSSFEIPSQGSRILRSAGVGQIRRGWIEVETDSASVSGLLTYRHTQSGVEVGVKPVELGNQFALFVEESTDIGTGLAIFKPESAPEIELRIRDEEGSDPLDGVFVPHGDFQQRARTMAEWFGVEGVDTGFLRDFRGLLFLRTGDGSLFAPLGLRFGKQTGSLSAVPVIRGGDVSGGMPPSGTGGAPPTVSLSASPMSVERGQSATLRWSSTNATSASITPGIGTVPTSGSRRISPTRTTTYRITVRSADGQTASASATVTVTEPPPPSLAPADQDAFNDVFVGKRALTDDPNDYIDFISPGRFKETEGSDEYPGSYTYGNTGSNTGTVTLNYDDGDRCTFRLTFASATSGRATFSCNDGTSGSSSWRLVEIPASGTPDLVIQTPSVSDSSPNAGGSFTFSATVRNQGNGLSASTTLRYYRSTDATISTSDTAVGTDAVDALTPAGTSDESISLTAPSTAGTYYYGACVDPVSGESNSQNNCSSAMRVTVAQVSDEDVYVRHESLTIGRGWVRYLNATDYASGSSCIDLTGATILHNGVPYILISSKWQTRANSSDAWADIPDTSESGRLCAYDPVDPGEYRFVAEISINGVVGKYSSNILGEGFDLASANRDASGITYANGKFYVEGRKG